MPDTFQLGGYDLIADEPFQPLSGRDVLRQQVQRDREKQEQNAKLRRQAELDQHLQQFGDDPVSKAWGEAEFRLKENDSALSARKQHEDEIGGQFDDPVAKAWAIAEQRLKRNDQPKVRAAQSEADAMEAKQRQYQQSAALDRVTPDNAFVRETVGGMLNAAPDFVSIAARLTGNGEAADELTRQSQEMGQARGALRETDWSPWLSGMYGGAVQNITQMAGTPGGAYGKIGGAALMTGNQALTTAEDAGLEGGARLRYAGTQALLEGGIAAIFQKLGLGGVEARLGGQAVASQTWKQLAKSVGKDALQEMPEEAITSILQDLSSKLEGVSPDMGFGEFVQHAGEAAVQAAMMSGIANTPNAAKVAANTAIMAFQKQPSRTNYKALPPELKVADKPETYVPPTDQRAALAEKLKQAPAAQGPTPEEQAAIDEENRLTALKSPGAQPDFVPPTENGDQSVPAATPNAPAIDFSQMSEDEIEQWLSQSQGGSVPAPPVITDTKTPPDGPAAPIPNPEQGASDAIPEEGQRRERRQGLLETPGLRPMDDARRAQLMRPVPEPTPPPQEPGAELAGTPTQGPVDQKAYRGTRKEGGFSGAASAGLGTQFATDSPEYASQYGDVAEVPVQFSNPYYMPLEEFRKYDRGPEANLKRSQERSKELVEAGHDGIVVTHHDGVREFITLAQPENPAASLPAGPSQGREARPEPNVEAVSPVPVTQGRYATYPINTSQGPRIAVQNGDKPGLGDTIHENQEAADKYVATTKARDEANAASRARDEARQTAEAEQKTKTDESLNDYLDSTGHTPMQKGKVKGALTGNAARRVSGDGKTYQGRRDAVVREMVADGWTPQQREVPAIKELTRTQFNRMDGKEQEAHEKKRAAAGTKTETVLVRGDSSFVVTKAEHDYADWLTKKNSQPPAPVSAPSPSVTTTASHEGQSVPSQGSEALSPEIREDYESQLQAIRDRRAELTAAHEKLQEELTAQKKVANRSRSPAAKQKMADIEAEWADAKEQHQAEMNKLAGESLILQETHPYAKEQGRLRAEAMKPKQAEQAARDAADQAQRDQHDWRVIVDRGGHEKVLSGLEASLRQSSGNTKRMSDKNKIKGESAQRSIQRDIDRVKELAAKFSEAPGPAKAPWQDKLDAIKKENGDALVMFRMGDFYELFGDDAKKAAATLGLTLTTRDKNSANPIPMAGFPYHALEGYLKKLVKSGHRVAVAEDPTGKKDAKRNITVTEPAAPESRPETYINGDRVEYTGTTQTLHGGKFYDVEFMEGQRKGQLGVTSHAPPQGTPNVPNQSPEPDAPSSDRAVSTSGEAVAGPALTDAEQAHIAPLETTIARAEKVAEQHAGTPHGDALAAVVEDVKKRLGTLRQIGLPGMEGAAAEAEGKESLALDNVANRNVLTGIGGSAFADSHQTALRRLPAKVADKLEHGNSVTEDDIHEMLRQDLPNHLRHKEDQYEDWIEEVGKEVSALITKQSPQRIEAPTGPKERHEEWRVGDRVKNQDEYGTIESFDVDLNDGEIKAWPKVKYDNDPKPVVETVHDLDRVDPEEEDIARRYDKREALEDAWNDYTDPPTRDQVETELTERLKTVFSKADYEKAGLDGKTGISALDTAFDYIKGNLKLQKLRVDSEVGSLGEWYRDEIENVDAREAKSAPVTAEKAADVGPQGQEGDADKNAAVDAAYTVPWVDRVSSSRATPTSPWNVSVISKSGKQVNPQAQKVLDEAMRAAGFQPRATQGDISFGTVHYEPIGQGSVPSKFAASTSQPEKLDLPFDLETAKTQMDRRGYAEYGGHQFKVVPFPGTSGDGIKYGIEHYVKNGDGSAKREMFSYRHDSLALAQNEAINLLAEEVGADVPTAAPLDTPLIPKYERTGPASDSPEIADAKTRLEGVRETQIKARENIRGAEADKKGKRRGSKAMKALEETIQYLQQRENEAARQDRAIQREIEKAKLEDVLENPPDYDHYLKAMADLYDDEAAEHRDARDEAERRDGYRRTKGDAYSMHQERVDAAQEKSDKYAVELMDRAKALALQDGTLNNSEATTVSNEVYRGFSYWSPRTLQEAVTQEIAKTKKARMGGMYGDVERFHHLGKERQDAYKKELDEAALGGKDWHEKSKEIVERARKEHSKNDDDRRAEAERVLAETKAAAEKAKAERDAEDRVKAQEHAKEKRVWKRLTERTKAAKWAKETYQVTEGDEKTDVQGEVMGPFGVHEVVSRDDGGVVKEKSYTVTHLATGLTVSSYKSKNDAKALAVWLADSGVNWESADIAVAGKITGEEGYKAGRFLRAFDDNNLRALNPDEKAEALASAGPKETDIQADRVLDASDLGVGSKNEAPFVKKVKEMSEAVPEFAYNPVFTVESANEVTADGKDKWGREVTVTTFREGLKLVFKDGMTFKFHPEVFNLEAEDLTPGQTIGINLEDLGIKRLDATGMVAAVFKEKGFQVTIGKSNESITARWKPTPYAGKTMAVYISPGDDGKWRVTTASEGLDTSKKTVPQSVQIARQVLDGIRWAQPGQITKGQEPEATPSDSTADDELADGGGIHRAVDPSTAISDEDVEAGETDDADGVHHARSHSAMRDEPIDQPWASTAAESVGGKKLLSRLTADSKSDDPSVGLRSIVEFLNDLSHTVLLVGRTQTSKTHPAHFTGDHKKRGIFGPAIIRSRFGSSQLNFHEAGHALSNWLRDSDPRFFFGLGEQLKDVAKMPGFASATTAEEGIAEVVRRFVVGETVPAELWSSLEKRLEKDQPDVLAGLRDAHRAYVFHRGRPQEQQMRANAGDQPPKGEMLAGLRNTLYWLAYNTFGGSWAVHRINRKLFKGISGSGWLSGGTGFGEMVRNAVSGKSRSLLALARAVRGELRNKPTDTEAAYQARMHATDEVARLMGGVRGDREGVRVLQLGDSLSQAATADGLEALRLAGFDISDDAANAPYGEYVYLSNQSFAKIKHAIGDRYQSFEVYAQYKAALSRWNAKKLDYPGMHDGLTPAKLKAFIEETETANPEWQGHFKDVQKLMDQMILVGVMSGEHSVESAINIRQSFEDYVPLPRQVEDRAAYLGIATGGASPTSGVYRAKGSLLDFRPLEESIEYRVRRSMTAYYENALRVSMLKMTDAINKDSRLPYDVRKTMARLMLPLRMESKRIATMTPLEAQEVVADAMNRMSAEKEGIDVEGVSPKELAALLEIQGLESFRPEDIAISLPGKPIYRQAAPRAVHVVTTFRNGELAYHQVTDPLLFDLFSGTKHLKPYLSWVARFVGKPLLPWRRMLTQNIAFALRNLPRDAITAMQLGEGVSSVIPGYVAGTALLNRLQGDPEGHRAQARSELLSKSLDHTNSDAHGTLWDSFRLMLGEGITDTGWSQLSAVDRAAEIPGIAMSALMKPIDVANWLTGGRWLSEQTESLPREGAFIAAKKRGDTTARAIRNYDRVTGQFIQRQPNAELQAVVRASGFLNPAIQIIGGQLEAMTDPDPASRAAFLAVKLPMLTAWAAVGAALNYMMILAMTEDDEEERRRIFKQMKERTEQDRLGTMSLGGFVRLPFDKGLAGAAVSFGWNDTEDWLYGVSPQLGADRATALLKRAADVPVPTDMVHPFWQVSRDLWQNHSEYMDADIVPQFLERKYPNNPELQTLPDVAETFNQIGRATNASPLKIRYAMRGVLGSDVVSLLQMMDNGAKTPSDLPVIGRLISRDPQGWSSRSVRSVIDLDDQYVAAMATAEQQPMTPELKVQIDRTRNAHQAMLEVERIWSGAKTKEQKTAAQKEMTDVSSQFLKSGSLNGHRINLLWEHALGKGEKKDESAKILKTLRVTPQQKTEAYRALDAEFVKLRNTNWKKQHPASTKVWTVPDKTDAYWKRYRAIKAM